MPRLEDRGNTVEIPCESRSSNGNLDRGNEDPVLQFWKEDLTDRGGSQDPSSGLEEMEEDHEEQTLVEEVSMTVPTTDSLDMLLLTLRTWIIGLPICSALAFVNQFFWFRSSPIIISALSGQIVSLYLGRSMARWLPDYRLGSIRLNPGPFTIKEHVLITILANCGSAFGRANADGMEIVTLLNRPLFFDKHISFGVAFLIVATTQTMGYGLAGIFRRYLVDPPQMWWPSTLVDVSLFRTLHERENKRLMSRIQFFGIAAVSSFVWYIVPDYFFITITSLSWICWAFKDSITLQQIGSGSNGLGLGAFAIDWATISAFLNSPLSTPVSTLVNVYGAFLVAAFVIVPSVYWNDIYNAQNFPIVTNKLFLQNGHRYNSTEVLDVSGMRLDEAKYAAYGRPHMAGSYVATHWGFVFAFIPAAVVHVCIWHGHDMFSRLKASQLGKEYKPDVHRKLMLKYKDIPSWWFLALLLVNLAASIITIQVWKDIFQITWVWVVFAVVLAFFFTLPLGVITATTNIFHGIGPLCNIIFGYLKPGSVVGLNSFRLYAAGTVVQTIAFLRDFKLAHYMKIPPCSMFIVQVVGTMVAALVNLGCAYWLFTVKPDLCEDSGEWTCPAATNAYQIAIVFGLVGTKRMFGETGQYKEINWMFLFGVLVPIFLWLLSKINSKLAFLKHVHLPVILAAIDLWPPARSVNYNSWFLIGIVFNFFIFRHRKAWWQRYNYVLSAALDTGVALGGPLLFLILNNNNKNFEIWWGNPRERANFDHCPLATCPTAKGISVSPHCPVF